MVRMPVAWALAVVGMTILHTACGGSEQAPVAEQPAPEPPVAVMLPAGDVAAGQQAFRDLKCTVCHAVSAEADFPEPFSANRGPSLGAGLADHGLSELAAAIVTPSHSLSGNVAPKLEGNSKGRSRRWEISARR